MRECASVAKSSQQIQELLQNEPQQNEEFNHIFDAIFTDATDAHLRMDVQERVLAAYGQNSVTQQFNVTKVYKVVDDNFFVGTLSNIIDRIKNYSPKRGLNETQIQQFSTALFRKTDRILQSTNIYSDYVVEEAITITNSVLQEYKLNKFEQKKQAHRFVFAFLVQKLKIKQHEWESKNLISARLKSERDGFRNLYNNTIFGMNGLRLLTTDLQAMLDKHWRDAYRHFICKKVVNQLQSASWVSNHRVLSAYADKELLDLIQAKQIKSHDLMTIITTLWKRKSRAYWKLYMQSDGGFFENN
jgi:hypothetical protein